ncbi:MAG: SRPBCC family protein ['Candidatus Kapabacteria' thiocyanatum]|uniref:ATPase n=1 Tax=Candidatus Kapaibacterium thiocyanatum TaxID=1895771 RepID=A0A1M3KZR5_9BACT|nr:SRPBCC family protein ['Candidatus Kapabacteria' thiocyanatum]OJX57835.1 MAG: ATPase ['Candidatus Kapabacteria' thiocyanatum]
MTADTPDLVLTRVFDAPRDLVFKAWTEPAMLLKWWGPRGFTNTFHEIDVRPGGRWLFIMHGPDGVDYPNQIVFDEVIRPERLVYTHGSGVEGDPGTFNVTVTFEEQGSRTLLTLRMLFPSIEERDRVVNEYGALEGGRQTLERLAEHLATLIEQPAVNS